jgi:hypothetical protein
MAGFENDFMDANFLGIPYLRQNHGAAHKWLAGMDTAALERKLPVQICMALAGDLMASVAFNSMTNYRCSTDYGISDSSSVLQANDGNYNIGGSSLLGFGLGLRPSKDILWTHRPDNCRGDPTADPSACGRWGAKTNPGSNCELNTIIATLSTGPVSLADKAGDTNATLVRRCVREDGRILQPDKPATSVDSMFAQKGSKRNPPTADGSGLVWATSTTVKSHVWHYVLSIDVKSSWRLHGDDLYPKLAAAVDMTREGGGAAEGWVAHPWFTGHAPTPCVHGSKALASGCVSASVKSYEDIPPIHNTRPIMVQNDTRVYDLMELAPVVHGWVLLGEVDRYVRVSSDRFDDITFSTAGIRASLRGSAGETAVVTALQPSQKGDWVVIVESATFGSTGKATIEFKATTDEGLR